MKKSLYDNILNYIVLYHSRKHLYLYVLNFAPSLAYSEWDQYLITEIRLLKQIRIVNF